MKNTEKSLIFSFFFINKNWMWPLCTDSSKLFLFFDPSIQPDSERGKKKEKTGREQASTARPETERRKGVAFTRHTAETVRQQTAWSGVGEHKGTECGCTEAERKNTEEDRVQRHCSMNYRVWGEPAQTHQRQAQRASHRKNRCNQRRRAEQAGTCSYFLLLTLKPSHVTCPGYTCSGKKKH